MPGTPRWIPPALCCCQRPLLPDAHTAAAAAAGVSSGGWREECLYASLSQTQNRSRSKSRLGR